MPLFTDLLTQGRTNMMRPGLVDSRDWYREKAAAVRSINTVNLVNKHPDQQRSAILPGFMYMFGYDPKFKDELPYYDRFPLVFPYAKTPDGFIGLNMHYLPYNLRIALLDKLMVFKSNNRMDETTRLKYSWATIDGVSKFAAAQPCVKQYLSSHVKTQFRKVDSEDWATAMKMQRSSLTSRLTMHYAVIVSQVCRAYWQSQVMKNCIEPKNPYPSCTKHHCPH